MTTMTTSKEGQSNICVYEGISTVKYLDSVGVQTIGIGATVSEIPDLRSWAWDKELPLKDGFALFINGLHKYEQAVNRALRVDVERHQFDALVSICYNIGIGGMTGSTFMKLINAKAPDRLIRNAIMAWTKQKELISRRTKEANLYIDGVYSDDKMDYFPVSTKSHKPIYRLAKSIDPMEYL